MILGRWLGAYRTDRFVISSPLPTSEITARARQAGATGFRSYSMLARGRVSGRVGPNRLVLVRRSWYRNSWRPVLIASLHPSDSGSLVSCQIRPNLAVIVFSWIWLALVAIAGVVGVIAYIAEGDPFALITLTFAPLFIAVSSLAGWFVRGDREFLRDVMGDISAVPGR